MIVTELNGKPPFDFDDAVVGRGFAVSKDGTRIPVMILYRKDTKLDGQQSDAAVRVRRIRHQHDARISTA